MNADRVNRAIQKFVEGGWTDTYETIHGAEDPGPTGHRFLGSERAKEKGKIDWIFWRGQVEITAADIINDNENGRYPSDHYFISAEIRLP